MAKFLDRKNKKNTDATPRRRSARMTDSSTATSAQEQPATSHAFRRNRTITGSSSPKISSSTELNAEMRSPRAHVHHLSSQRRRLWMYFIAVMLMAVALYVLLSQLVVTLLIHTEPETDVAQDNRSYQRTIDAYYSARPAERFRFLLNEPELLSHAQASNPEIKGIEIRSTGEFGKAEFVITPRKPIARWTIRGENQYVDAAGVVFKRNYFATPKLSIVDASGIRAENTQIVTSHRFLGFVGRVIGLAQTSGYQVTKVTIPFQTTRQVDIQLQGVQQRYKLSVDRSTGDQVEDIVRITKYLKKNNIAATYVDVRVQGKATYR